ncbi:MAG: hypothetical protein WAN14_22080 [Candidatus Acidiferrales bacterium]
MTYRRPEIEVLEIATSAIRGGKGDATATDMSFQHTTGAYQADE